MATQANDNKRASATRPAGDEKPVGRTPPPSAPRGSKAARTASEMITGDILTNSRLRRWYPLALYCVLLIFIYISHNFSHQRLQRIELRTRMQLNEARSRAMVFSSMRMNASRHSKIIEQVTERSIPLQESTTPPVRIER